MFYWRAVYSVLLDRFILLWLYHLHPWLFAPTSTHRWPLTLVLRVWQSRLDERSVIVSLGSSTDLSPLCLAGYWNPARSCLANTKPLDKLPPSRRSCLHDRPVFSTAQRGRLPIIGNMLWCLPSPQTRAVYSPSAVPLNCPWPCATPRNTSRVTQAQIPTVPVVSSLLL